MEHSLSGRWSLVDPETGEGEDTAMGLPHPKHNPNCEIEKNPTFALRVRRPCDVRVVLTQRDGSGVAPAVSRCPRSGPGSPPCATGSSPCKASRCSGTCQWRRTGRGPVH